MNERKVSLFQFRCLLGVQTLSQRLESRSSSCCSVCWSDGVHAGSDVGKRESGPSAELLNF
jgi:hypothetical protein